MPKAYIGPPVPILDVLDAALQALAADGRFRSVPNGRYEVSWRQPSKGRDGDGDRPQRYALMIECAYTPAEAGTDG